MMNPYYYLFYRLSQFLNKKGNNEWGPIYALTVLVGWNIVVAYVKHFGITSENSQGTYKTVLILIAIALFITNSILFLNKQRVETIMDRYNGESTKSRKIGGFLLILYIVLSLGLIMFL